VKDYSDFKDKQDRRGDGLILVLNVLEVAGTGKECVRLKINIYDAIMKMSHSQTDCFCCMDFVGTYLKISRKILSTLTVLSYYSGILKETLLTTASVQPLGTIRLSWK
jgi:hypothetical protein